MAGNRKAAEKEIIDGIEAILPNGGNKEIYENFFKSLSDTQFDEFMKALEEERQRLTIVVPNLSKASLSVERNLKLAKKWGHNFFERIWIKRPGEDKPFLSNKAYPILELNVKRQAQTLVSKIKIPENNNAVDDLTGQPSGKNKTAKLSYPEMQMLTAMGLERNIIEMMKYRGGDEQGFRAMNESIEKQGGVKQQYLDSLGTNVKVNRTLGIYLSCMHLSNTLPNK